MKWIIASVCVCTLYLCFAGDEKEGDFSPQTFDNGRMRVTVVDEYSTPKNLEEFDKKTKYLKKKGRQLFQKTNISTMQFMPNRSVEPLALQALSYHQGKNSHDFSSQSIDGQPHTDAEDDSESEDEASSQENNFIVTILSKNPSSAVGAQDKRPIKNLKRIHGRKKQEDVICSTTLKNLIKMNIDHYPINPWDR
jgi:hypothetical protein